MRIIATLFIAAVSLTSSIAADFLDIPADGVWAKVQDKADLTRWSAISPKHPNTRIDFISVRDGRKWMTYYLVRSTCSDHSKLKFYTIKPGDQLGVGANCDGALIGGDSTPIDEVQKLPPAAAALLKR